MAKPTTIEKLEANIIRVINQIPVKMLERVMENWNFRMDGLSCSCGQYLKDIKFKIYINNNILIENTILLNKCNLKKNKQ